jgi:hypothetical protein
LVHGEPFDLNSEMQHAVERRGGIGGAGPDYPGFLKLRHIIDSTGLSVLAPYFAEDFVP